MGVSGRGGVVFGVLKLFSCLLIAFTIKGIAVEHEISHSEDMKSHFTVERGSLKVSGRGFVIKGTQCL